MSTAFYNEGDPAPTDAQTTVDPGTSAHYFGNQHDDDGAALDSYFEAAPASPVRSEYVVPAETSIPARTRVLSKSIDMTNYNVGDSVLLWPADPNRQYLHIESNVQPVDVNIPTSATALNQVLWSGSPSSRSTGLTGVLNVVSVDTAGSLVLQGSADGISWQWYFSKSLTSAGGTTVTLAGPLPPYLRILCASGATGAGQVNGILSYDDGLEGFAWGSEPVSQVSPVTVFSPVNTDQHTGAVYAAKVFPNATIISTWVVTS